MFFFFFGKETKAEIITRENKKRLFAKEEEKEENKWSFLSHSIEEGMRENLNSGIHNLEDFLKSCKSNLVKYQVEIVGLTACLKAWKEHCKSQGKGMWFYVCVFFFTLINWRINKK